MVRGSWSCIALVSGEMAGGMKAGLALEAANGAEAAIDGETLAGDGPIVGSHQKCHRRRHILWCG
jgi:hypothetical protein